MKFFQRFALLLGIVALSGESALGAHTFGDALEGWEEPQGQSNTSVLLRSVAQPHSFAGKNVAAYSAAGVYQQYSQYCQKNYAAGGNLDTYDLDKAFGWAAYEMSHKYGNLYGKARDDQVSNIVDHYFGQYRCFSRSYDGPKIQKPKSCEVSRANYCKYDSIFRTIDGSCNNPHYSNWGAAKSCHQRLLPAFYADGKGAMRDNLPNARSLSNRVLLPKNQDTHYTSMVLGWGQFMNHDIVNTAAPMSGSLNCCKNPGKSQECYPIMFKDQYDEIGSKYGSRCQNFIRSAPCGCKSGVREQLNLQTSFMDMSLVYGADIKEAASLRAGTKGLLRSVKNLRGEPILPVDEKAQPCVARMSGLKCFLAGDPRVNQHPLLLSMHTIFLRNHNHHATQLGRMNPQWNDERIYQEARRLNIAELQHISYSEYLPLVLGKHLFEYYQLKPLKTGYTKYDAYMNPTTITEYISAAARFGHSQMKDFYHVISKDRRSQHYNSSMFELKENFFEPGFAWEGLLEDVLRGATNEFSNQVDSFFSMTSKNYVMRVRNKSPFGIDLVATNVQRGRDHGIPGYVHYLKVCHNHQARNWKDLERYIPRSGVSTLSAIYSRIEDIDLYMGAMSEEKVGDSSVGPTVGCLVGQQFHHLKFGDRYFYEHGGQAGSFTPVQLDNIRDSASISRILCRNGWNIDQMQRRAFFFPSGYNPIASCSSLPDIDYRHWQEVRRY